MLNRKFQSYLIPIEYPCKNWDSFLNSSLSLSLFFKQKGAIVSILSYNFSCSSVSWLSSIPADGDWLPQALIVTHIIESL